MVVTIEGGALLFYPDGTLEECMMVIRDKRGRSTTITSKGFDGKITVGTIDNST